MPHTLLCTAVTFVALNGAMPAFAQDAGPDWSTFVPPVDGSFVTWETPPDLELVKRLFTLAYPENCSWALGTGVAPEPQVFEFTYRNDYDEPDAPERPFRLYQIFCSAGAYNEQAVFMAWDESTGVRTIYFAQPAFDFVYSDET